MYTTRTRKTKYSTLTGTEIATTNGNALYITYESKTSFIQSVMWFPNNTPIFDIINAPDNSITNIWCLVKNN